MTILASFVKWVITHKTLKSCPERGEISINYYDYYSPLSFTSRGSNMFSEVLQLWRWIDLGSKACLCLCLAARLLARCWFSMPKFLTNIAELLVFCSIFLNCIKWCHLGSWSMIDAPCMVAVVTSSPSRCLQPFNSAWGQRGNEVLQDRKIRSVVVWVSGCLSFQFWKETSSLGLLRKMPGASLVDVPTEQEGAVPEAQGLSPGR